MNPSDRAPAGQKPAAPDVESTYALVLRARAGDRPALDALCERYRPRMQRWAHGRLPPWARGLLETQDIVQDTLYKVAGHVESFEPRHEGAFQGYVRQALFNRIRDEVRGARGKFAETIDTARPTAEPSPLEEAIGSELLERYEAALQRIKPDDRDAIVARVELGLTWNEIAEALGKSSTDAARMTVTRALIRLAQEMSHERRP